MTQDELLLLKKDFLLGKNLSPDKPLATYIGYTEDPDHSYVLKEINKHHIGLYRTLKRIQSPYIAAIYDIRQYGTSYVAVVEHVYGDTLENHIEKNGPFSEKKALACMAQLSEVLIQIHRQKIVHKDISPGNLILTEEGRLKLIDFAGSRLISDPKRNDTEVMGTIGFVAPEVCSYIPSSYTADIYSAGCVLNYLLTGKYVNEKLYREDKFLEHIIRRTTCFDPRDRIQSAEMLKRMVEAAQAEQKLLSSEQMLLNLKQKVFPSQNEHKQGVPGQSGIQIKTAALAAAGAGLILLLGRKRKEKRRH